MKTLFCALTAAVLLAGTAPALAATPKGDAALAKKCALPSNKRNAKCIAFKKAHMDAMASGDAMMSDGAMKHDDAMMSSGMSSGDQMKSDKPK